MSLDFQTNWHEGIANLEEVSNGDTFDMEAMKALPIHICVGDSDFDRDRLEKAKHLKHHYKHVGIWDVHLDIVEHAKHNSSKMTHVVSKFFRRVL